MPPEDSVEAGVRCDGAEHWSSFGTWKYRRIGDVGVLRSRSSVLLLSGASAALPSSTLTLACSDVILDVNGVVAVAWARRALYCAMGRNERMSAGFCTRSGKGRAQPQVQEFHTILPRSRRTVGPRVQQVPEGIGGRVLVNESINPGN